MGSRIPQLLAGLLLALAPAAIIPAVATAANYSVVGEPDGGVLPDGHACDATPIGGFTCATLRAAVIASDTAGGSNMIQLPYGTNTLSIAPSGADDATTGDLNITTATTVIGAGPSASVVDANGIDRAFSVADGASLTLDAMEIVNGKTGPASKPDAAGGAIEALGSARLTLDDVRLVGNTASGAGGGAIAAASGPVSITRSWIEDNHGGGDGGGVLAVAPSSLSIDASTLDGNTAAGNGGGLSFSVGTSTPLTNSTVFNNTAGAAGGGIYADLGSGQLTITHATIVQNTAATVAGNILTFGAGSVSLENSIVGAGTVAGAPHNCAIATASVDAGNNLFFDLPYAPGSTDNCLPGGLSTTDIPAGDGRLAKGPGLDATSGGALNLASNGGPTATLALVAGSPALNAANPSACAASFPGAGGVDQRGSTRFPGPIKTCDIGAYEPEALLTLTGSVSPTSGTVGQPLTFRYAVSNAGPSTATATTLTGSLPGGAFGGLAPSQGSCSFLAGVNCALGEVFNTQTATLNAAVTPAAPGTYSMTVTATDAESGATSPVTVSAPVTGTPLPGAAPGAPTPGALPKKSVGNTTAKSTSRCGSRRRFKIHVQHAAAFRIVSAKIFVAGRLRATVRAPRLSATINLIHRPTGKFTVRIVALRRNGRTLVGKRVYHPCNPRLNGHKYLFL